MRRLLVFGALMGALAAVRVPLLRGAAHWLDVGQPPAPVDYIVVLPGEVNTRPFVAAAWVKRGLAKRVIIPQPRPSPESVEGHVPTEEQVIRRVLELRGVRPDDIIVVAGQSGSTYDDALAIARRLENEPDARVAIVTNTFHTRRALWTFERAFYGRPNKLRMVSAPTDRYSADNWWRVREGIQAYANEYVKLAAYWIFYGGAVLWLCGVGAVMVAMIVLRYRRTKRPPKVSSPTS